jgi:hypothetical protein
MAFDIYITGFREKIEKQVSLRLSDYYIIKEKINCQEKFPIMKKCFNDYYGEYEIYFNELPDLKEEVLSFSNINSLNSDSLKNFISLFLEIIDYAIKNNQSIKFVGD